MDKQQDSAATAANKGNAGLGFPCQVIDLAAYRAGPAPAEDTELAAAKVEFEEATKRLARLMTPLMAWERWLGRPILHEDWELIEAIVQCLGNAKEGAPDDLTKAIEWRERIVGWRVESARRSARAKKAAETRRQKKTATQ